MYISMYMHALLNVCICVNVCAILAKAISISFTPFCLFIAHSMLFHATHQQQRLNLSFSSAINFNWQFRRTLRCASPLCCFCLENVKWRKLPACCAPQTRGEREAWGERNKNKKSREEDRKSLANRSKSLDIVAQSRQLAAAYSLLCLCVFRRYNG